MKSRKTQLALAVAMSATLALSACASGGGGGGNNGQGGGNGPEAQSADQAAKLVSNNAKDRNTLEQGGSVTLPLSDWTTNFNAWHVDGNGADFNDIIDATDPMLFDWNPDGTMKPRPEFLLEMPKAEDKDGKEVITYKLNPKAKWNDGTAIDWTAFEATWKVNKEPVDKGGFNNIATTGYEDIEKVEKGAAANEVVVTFKKAFYPPTEIFQSLMHPKLAESPKAFNDMMKTDFHPELRSGPFTLDNLDQSAKTITLKPNPNWWGNKPLLNKIVYRQMEDQATIPAFKNGEIDATGVANKARFAQIQGAQNMDIRRSQRTTTVVFVFNSKAENLTDVNVRKALWQGIDREEWKKVRFNGLNWTEKPANSALYFSFQPEAEDNMPVQFNVEEAKKTLQGAGYTMGSDGFFAKDGKKLSIKYTTFGDDPLTTALAQLMQGQMKKIGVDLQLDIRPAAAFGSTMEKRDFGFLQMAWSSNSSNPLTSTCQTMCSDSQSNYSAAGTPELDKRLRDLGSIKDPAAQAKEMNAVEKEWMAATYGQMPIANGPVMTATRKGLANWGPALFASMHPKWEDVGWEKGSTHK